VYALGAVGFFLVTGREVFAGGSVIEVCSKHLSTAPESPSAVLGQEIDAGLEGLILRCLAKRPDERPSDGAALAQELEQLDLSGWTDSDAKSWWRDYPAKRASAKDHRPSERTQLTVNVDDRR
jgi:serine/threonine-protein kinase